MFEDIDYNIRIQLQLYILKNIIYYNILQLKDRITPQINFFQWSQADVKMRWERQEGKEMVQDRLGERAVCDNVVCVSLCM